ncbi:MAG: hypothetical protein DRJ35_01410 [Thermoprotei archaeon]|nr:MAG: hypothetical protein DRJ35_01410 [Thermoprotei archaeon]
MENIVDLLIQIADIFGGYLGIFVVSVVGNLIPFIPIPYLVAVYLYAAYIPGSNPFLVGVVSGIGGGVGKLAVYYLSRGASVFISDKSKKKLEKMREILGNYGALAVFLFAATPSPDDVIIALLGLMKYNVLKFFVSITAGKILISVLTAYTGRIVVETLGREKFWESVVVSIVIFVIVMLVVTFINWEKILEILGTKGWKGLLEEINKKGLRKILFENNKKE